MVEQLHTVVQRQHGQAAEQHAEQHQAVRHLGFGAAAEGQGDAHRLGRFESQEQIQRLIARRNRKDEVATDLLWIEQRARQTIANLAEQLVVAVSEEIQVAHIGRDDAQQALLGVGLDAGVQPECAWASRAMGLGRGQRLEGGEPVADLVEGVFSACTELATSSNSSQPITKPMAIQSRCTRVPFADADVEYRSARHVC